MSWGQPHDTPTVELHTGSALLLHELVTAVLKAHPDTPVDRPTRHAIGELRDVLHRAGKVA